MPTAQLVDQHVRQSFPHPVAAAWHRLSLATSDAQRVKRLLACQEVLVRTLTAMVLPDYLRGKAAPAVEKALKRLERPALGHWVSLLRETLRRLRTRTDPAPFMPEACAWYFVKGRPSAHARRLDALVSLRNEETHGPAPAAEASARVARIEGELRELLLSLGWLSGYRPFRLMGTPTLSRRGGFTGRLQILTGAAPEPAPREGSWTTRLLEEAVYLANPAGDAVLELSPFAQVLFDAGPRDHRLFLVSAVPRRKRVALTNDLTGSVQERLVALGDREVTFEQWLAHRDELTLFLENESGKDALRAPAADAAGLAVPAPPAPDSDRAREPVYHLQGPDGRRIMRLSAVVERLADNPDPRQLLWQPGWEAWRSWTDVEEVAARLTDQAPLPADPQAARIEGAPLDTVLVEAGHFDMGAPGRTVTLTRPFRIGVTPVTQALFGAVAGASPSASKRPDRPVERVSWEEAIRFCNLLSERRGLEPAYRLGDYEPRKRYSLDDMGRMLYDLVPFKRIAPILATFALETLQVLQFQPGRLSEVPGIGAKTAASIGKRWDRDAYFTRDVVWVEDAPGFRLPTEAEWAYAAREGAGDERASPAPVRRGPANPQGLYDTAGNVWEWVWDRDPDPVYAPGPRELAEEEITDPRGSSSGARRLCRLGALRACHPPDHRAPDLGFRIARTSR